MTEQGIEECLEMLEAKAEMTRTRFDKSRSIYTTALSYWPSDETGLRVVSMAVFQAEDFPDVSTLQRLYREAISEDQKSDNLTFMDLRKSLCSTQDSGRRAFAEGFYKTKDLPVDVEEWIARNVKTFPGWDMKTKPGV